MHKIEARIGVRWRGKDVGGVDLVYGRAGGLFSATLNISEKEPRRLIRLAIFQNTEKVFVPAGSGPHPDDSKDYVDGAVAALRSLAGRIGELEIEVPAGFSETFDPYFGRGMPPRPPIEEQIEDLGPDPGPEEIDRFLRGQDPPDRKEAIPG